MEALELIEVKPGNELQVFAADDKAELKALIAHVEKEARSLVPDISTAKGRSEIASNAHKVTKCKTYLEGVGKELADQQKQIPKKIDASRRFIKETLDKLRDEVRKPLTDWEAEQEAIKARKQAVLDEVRALGQPPHDMSAADLQARLEKAEGYALDKDALDDFFPMAAEAKIAAIHHLKGALANRTQYEADQAELARLRKLQEEQAVATKAAPVQEAVTTADDDFSDFDDAIPTTAAAPIAASNGHAATPDDHQRAVERVATQALIDGGLPPEQAQHAVRLIAKGKIPGITISY